MAHSLTPLPPAAAATNFTPASPSFRPQRVCAVSEAPLINRRTIAIGLSGVLASLNAVNGNAANAAARRPPPPPPEERKDPNVTGVQAKVLASKKRKEAMKAATAKLREKGKPVEEPSSSSSSSSQ